MHESLLLPLELLSGLDNHQIYPIGGGDRPLYPLFPPDLIPGMVRKMWIVSGVPYSPLSPLDILTVIPSFIVISIERVSRFFKEIGSVNPVEKSLMIKGSSQVHTNGACIPLPPNLQVVQIRLHFWMEVLSTSKEPIVQEGWALSYYRS